MKTKWMLTLTAVPVVTRHGVVDRVSVTGLLVPASLMERIHKVLTEWTGDHGVTIKPDDYETPDEVYSRMRAEEELQRLNHPQSES